MTALTTCSTHEVFCKIVVVFLVFPTTSSLSDVLRCAVEMCICVRCVMCDNFRQQLADNKDVLVRATTCSGPCYHDPFGNIRPKN